MKPDFEKILAEAHEAARLAVTDIPDKLACGWAWATIAGTEPLARHCRAKLKEAHRDDYPARRYYGDKHYPTGWQFWQPGNFRGQSVWAHEQGAIAFRDALATHGICAQLGSRLD